MNAVPIGAAVTVRPGVVVNGTNLSGRKAFVLQILHLTNASGACLVMTDEGDVMLLDWTEVAPEWKRTGENA